MSISLEIDRQMREELRKLATPPIRTQFYVVLNTEARNQFLAELKPQLWDFNFSGRQRYKGAIVCVSHDDEMPPITILTKEIK